MTYIKISEKLQISVFTPLIILFLLSFASPIYAISVIAAIAVHESGHLLVSLILGEKISRVKIMPLGVDIRYAREIIPYKNDITILSAGIFFNILFALIFANFRDFCGISLYLAAVNALPVRILDGGRILENILLLKFSEKTAIKISKCVSFFTVIILWIFAVFVLFYTEFNAAPFFFVAYLFSACFLRA